MPDMLIIASLFVIGLIVLVADIFLPSHFILTAIGLAFLGVGIYKVFNLYGALPGVVSIVTCLVVWPLMAYYGVKNWYRTPAGKLLAPLNPTLTAAHLGVEVESLIPLIGERGVAVTPLRPVGICQFGDRRVPCLAELGRIDDRSPVVGLAARAGQLVVGEVKV